jgi:hypothetical protein
MDNNMDLHLALYRVEHQDNKVIIHKAIPYSIEDLVYLDYSTIDIVDGIVENCFDHT